MLHITARVPTAKLKIRRSMSRLFQAFCYVHLPQKEHEGYRHSSGKRFKSTNFRIRYFDDRFEIDFVALDEEYEQLLAMAILKNGLRLGEVHIAETTVSLQQRQIPEGDLLVRGFVCAAIKNRLTGQKIFLEPGDSRHTEIITANALQKHEALLGRPYGKELVIEPVWQSPKPHTFWYEKTPYVAWDAKYKISADDDMKRLLLQTGMGSDTMKNLGFLEII